MKGSDTIKKLIALLLSIILVFSICSVSAFAEETEEESEYKDNTIRLTINLILSCFADNIISYNQTRTMILCFDPDDLKNDCYISDEFYDTLKTLNESFKVDTTTEYSFGQGTFVVGLDLKPGTYDITCESSSGNDMDSSMAGLSDFYNSQGMSEYADMINSMSGMYDTIGGLTVMTYKPNTSYYDQYLTLKAGETARIILEDGGKIEISDGTAKLVWIR